jgi:hypothetical protein
MVVVVKNNCHTNYIQKHAPPAQILRKIFNHKMGEGRRQKKENLTTDEHG